LALNSSFSALWVGQLISLFGDRIHQIALAFLVLGLTQSPVAVAFVFVAATLPNLLLSPIAGTYVDRWDQKDVMVVSDLLRAAIILLVPIAAFTNVLLVYPLVFAVTSISIFFRPARVAALPRIVREDELLTANSAMWIAETLADIVGYPLAAVFVAFLGTALPLAFWIDAATYAASAALIFSIVVPPVPRSADAPEKRPSVMTDLVAGYRFLRNEHTLLANTLQATVAQFTLGVLIALTPYYAKGISVGQGVDEKAAYGFLEAAIGVGNLIGGVAIGIVGSRFARGKTVIVGYAALGACVAALALVGNLGLAIGLMFGAGVANMIFVIPSQTMFQERTPADMLGRVVGFRFALVFGSMTIAMGVSGLLAASLGAAAVIGVFGFMTMLAGLGGLLVPAVRDA
jgi:MFS family permease